MNATELEQPGEPSVSDSAPKRKPGRSPGPAAAARRAYVLSMHADGCSLQEIGEELRIARTDVHQIIAKAKVAREQEAALSNPAVLEKYVRPELWADHGGEKLVILKSEIPWALKHMFGIPPGLISHAFLEKAKRTIELHYPKLRKSAVHVAMDHESTKFFVQVPDWAKKRFDQIIRLCDLLETMTFDGDSSG